MKASGKAKAKAKTHQRYKRIRLEHFDAAIRELDAASLAPAFFDESQSLRGSVLQALALLREGIAQ